MRHLAAFIVLVGTTLGLLGLSANAGETSDCRCLENKKACTQQPAKTNESRYADSLHFTALGDMGAGTPFQYDVAKAMVTEYDQDTFPIALMLGDLLYPDGNINRLGAEKFEAPYEPLISRGVRFRAALGNHDRLYPFTNKLVKYWKMPASYYHFRRGPVDFYAIDSNRFDTKQAAWLRESLDESTAPWKIVFGHHPVYSSGAHGLNRSLEKKLVPILLCKSVDLYLSGHDHDYERFSPKGGVEYIVSGGGGAYLRNFKHIQEDSLVRAKKHHFLNAHATDTSLIVEAVDKKGDVFDTLSLTKASKPAVSTCGTDALSRSE